MTIEEQLIGHEGLKLKPYTDTVGKLTIGVGRNLTDVGISTDEAMQLLASDIARARTGARMSLSNFDQLDDARQRVLIDMVFNMGAAKMREFVHMLSAIQQGDYARAADEMLDSQWAQQVGDRALQLAAMMRTGQVPV